MYIGSKWPIEYYMLKVAFDLASQNQMIINQKRLKKICNGFYKFFLCMQIFRVNFYEPLRFFCYHLSCEAIFLPRHEILIQVTEVELYSIQIFVRGGKMNKTENERQKKIICSFAIARSK